MSEATIGTGIGWGEDLAIVERNPRYFSSTGGGETELGVASACLPLVGGRTGGRERGYVEPLIYVLLSHS